MIIYVAYKRVRYDIDEVLGVFDDKDQAEQAIARFLAKVKEDKMYETVEEMLFHQAASFEVDAWEVGSTTRKDNWGLTEDLLKELIKQAENP